MRLKLSMPTPNQGWARTATKARFQIKSRSVSVLPGAMSKWRVRPLTPPMVRPVSSTMPANSQARRIASPRASAAPSSNTSSNPTPAAARLSAMNAPMPTTASASESNTAVTRPPLRHQAGSAPTPAPRIITR